MIDLLLQQHPEVYDDLELLEKYFHTFQHEKLIGKIESFKLSMTRDEIVRMINISKNKDEFVGRFCHLMRKKNEDKLKMRLQNALTSLEENKKGSAEELFNEIFKEEYFKPLLSTYYEKGMLEGEASEFNAKTSSTKLTEKLFSAI